MPVLKLVLSFLIFICLTKITSGQINAVGSIGITVSNMDRSVKFYSETLGFKKISNVELQGTEYENLEGIYGLHMRVVRMQLGDEYIDVTDYLTSRGRPVPAN